MVPVTLDVTRIRRDFPALADGDYTLRASLAHLEEDWGPAGFTRVHRTHLVNLAHAIELRGLDVARVDDALGARGGERHREDARAAAEIADDRGARELQLRDHCIGARRQGLLIIFFLLEPAQDNNSDVGPMYTQLADYVLID